VSILEKRGVEFLTSDTVRTSERGALTKARLGSVMFELVHTEPPAAAAAR
jgi:4-hydroxyphenylpyruvate dioxygenase